MPPVKAPGGWSQARPEDLREFDRASYGGLRGPTSTLMYAVVCDGDVVGKIRMARRDEPDTMETGMWPGEPACGTATHREIGRGCGLQGNVCSPSELTTTYRQQSHSRRREMGWTALGSRQIDCGAG
jgi:hypothetical protein